MKFILNWFLRKPKYDPNSENMMVKIIVKKPIFSYLITILLTSIIFNYFNIFTTSKLENFISKLGLINIILETFVSDIIFKGLWCLFFDIRNWDANICNNIIYTFCHYKYINIYGVNSIRPLLNIFIFGLFSNLSRRKKSIYEMYRDHLIFNIILYLIIIF